MWTTTHVDRTGGITNVMVNKQNLLSLIDGYCRYNSNEHLPRDIINIIYVFGKQLWTLLGGKYFELFDLVYHSMTLPEKIIRTYLHQIVDEIQKNPNMIIIEPTDLLLDESFSIFIVNQVNKTNVNTYLAPELLNNNDDKQKDNYLDKEKDLHKCAIFSIGVILFILLIGNIPFELATKSDKWYNCILQEKFEKFWRTFKTNGTLPITQNAKEMLENMLSSWDKRWDINKLKQCKFYKGDIYETSQDIIARFKYQYNKKEEERRRIIRDNYINIYKVSECLNINHWYDINKKCDMFPDDEIEGIFDTYSSGFKFRTIYYCLIQVIEEKYKGSTHFLRDKQAMICYVKTDRDKIKFGVKIFESKRFKIAHSNSDFTFNESQYEPLYVIRFYRIEGDSYEFLKIKNLGLLTCADIMSGLTQRQRRAFRDYYTIMLDKQRQDKLKNNQYYVYDIPINYIQDENKKYHWY